MTAPTTWTTIGTHIAIGGGLFYAVVDAFQSGLLWQDVLFVGLGVSRGLKMPVRDLFDFSGLPKTAVTGYGFAILSEGGGRVAVHYKNCDNCFVNVRNKPGTCAYCRETKKLTRDHVPPRVFFSKPYPENMPTVPACSECNGSFTANDEYTRVAIGLDVRASHRDVIGNMASLSRSFVYPDARKFVKSLVRRMRRAPILGVNGTPIVKFVQDVNRIDATGERIVC